MKKKIVIFLFVMLSLILLISGFDSRLETTYYTYESDEIPDSFHGYKIVQISDFHCKAFGNKEEELLQEVIECEPDLIVLTGDVIDRDHKIDNAYYLINGLAGIAPIYAIEGNHEADDLHTYMQLRELYRVNNVTLLADRHVTIHQGDEYIHLFGITDRYVRQYKQSYDVSEISSLAKLAENEFSVLLFHYADEFDFISLFDFDLVLAGHVHGGIIRFPFIGGLLANDHSLFPEYDAGMYIENNHTMIVSRGLGDTNLPRYYNRSELVCVELKTKR